MHFVVDALHRDVTGAVLRERFVAGVVVQVSRRRLPDDDDLGVKLLQPGIGNLSRLAAVVGRENDRRLLKLDFVDDAFHEVRLKVAQPHEARAAFQRVANHSRHVVVALARRGLGKSVLEERVVGVGPEDVDTGGAALGIAEVHPLPGHALKDAEGLRRVIPQLAVVLERLRLVGLRCLVLHDVEVDDGNLGVEHLDAVQVVLIRVGRDEPRDPLPLAQFLEIGDVLVGCAGADAAVDLGEVVAVVADGEHVAVADGVALDDGHDGFGSSVVLQVSGAYIAPQCAATVYIQFLCAHTFCVRTQNILIHMTNRTQRTTSATASDDDGGDNATVKWSQERRLQFIDFRLQWEGRINRKDVTEFFKISVNQASADLALYQHLMPDNMRYDTSTRIYVANEDFKPRSDISGARQYLSQLLALHRGILTREQAFLSFEPPVDSVPLPARNLDTSILLPLIQAIAERGKLMVKYQTISRDEAPGRFISPHAFGYDGIRWHVRAYCETRCGFRDFVLGRILSADQPEATHIKSSDDLEWHQYVDLVLKPDPTLTPSQRRGVELDYAMKNGTTTISCRKAMLYYTLRTLNFEISGQPRSGEKQLVIANLPAIKTMLPKFGQA